MSISRNRDPKILFFDIETAPNLSYIWGMYEQNALSVEQNWHIMSFSAKWSDEKSVISYALPDFKTYRKDRFDDKKLVEQLWALIDSADIVIAHNGDAFDIKKVNARFIEHGMCPPSPYVTIDTLKVARKFFRFDSNKLNDLGQHLGVGQKVKTGGFDLWKGCLNGDKKSWNLMKKYNKQDVVLLEKVYLKLRPWMTNHPNHNVFSGKSYTCPKCGSSNVQKRGERVTNTRVYQSYFCNDCRGWSNGTVNILEIPVGIK